MWSIYKGQIIHKRRSNSALDVGTCCTVDRKPHICLLSEDVTCIDSRDLHRAGYFLNPKDLLKHNPCCTKKHGDVI